MAYRARINLNDPRLQTSLRNASKGNAAIKGASANVRGLYSKYGQSEGQRLGGLERAGERLSNAKKNLEVTKSLNRQTIGLGERKLKFEKDQFNDAKLGSWIGAGLGALSTAGTLYGSYQDRMARDKQKLQQNAMMKEWVKNNPLTAYQYEANYPGAFGLQSFLTPDIMERARTVRARTYPTSAR